MIQRRVALAESCDLPPKFEPVFMRVLCVCGLVSGFVVLGWVAALNGAGCGEEWADSGDWVPVLGC